MAVDVGELKYQQRQQQSATDAAALGGAQQLAVTGCGNSSAATTAADNDATDNGFVTAQRQRFMSRIRRQAAAHMAATPAPSRSRSRRITPCGSSGSSAIKREWQRRPKPSPRPEFQRKWLHLPPKPHRYLDLQWGHGELAALRHPDQRYGDFQRRSNLRHELHRLCQGRSDRKRDDLYAGDAGANAARRGSVPGD